MKVSAPVLATLVGAATSAVLIVSFLDERVLSMGFLSPSGNKSNLRVEHNQGRRRLPDVISDFRSLSCNAELASAPCDLWSDRYGTASVLFKKVVIPCGECVVMDHSATESLTLKLGMDIQGKLIMEEDHPLVLYTPFIIVQGELKMTSTKPVSGTPSLRIVLTGDDDQSLIPVGENKFACNGGASPCTVGKKVIAVAGGTANSTFELCFTVCVTVWTPYFSDTCLLDCVVNCSSRNPKGHAHLASSVRCYLQAR
jgi:G8 domain